MVEHIEIIAEIGVNHDGDVTKAKELFELAKNSGADTVKVQCFDPSALVAPHTPTATYQKNQTGLQSQNELLDSLTLTSNEILGLANFANDLELNFLATPYDETAVDFLNKEIGLKRFKIASGDITNGPLLLKIAQTEKPIILSTGMSTIDDITNALALVGYGYANPKKTPQSYDEIFSSAPPESSDLLTKNVTLMQCTSAYPCPDDEVNLRCIRQLKVFNCAVGFSDHSIGISAALGAVALGASTIEKHITLDQNAKGPDHHMSMPPLEFKNFVTTIRRLEKQLGSDDKTCTQTEKENLSVSRRGLKAKKNIRKGELFNPENLVAQRPFLQRSPMTLWQLFNQPANRDYKAGEEIE